MVLTPKALAPMVLTPKALAPMGTHAEGARSYGTPPAGGQGSGNPDQINLTIGKSLFSFQSDEIPSDVPNITTDFEEQKDTSETKVYRYGYIREQLQNDIEIKEKDVDYELDMTENEKIVSYMIIVP